MNYLLNPSLLALAFLLLVPLSYATAIDLSVLVLLPMFEEDAADCRTACEIAIDVANRQPAFSKYRIVPEFRSSGYPAPKALLEFSTNCSSKSGMNCSALIVGPSTDDDCRSIVPTLPLLNLVAITPGCRSPVYTQKHSLYPNLFRSQIPVEVQHYAKLKFITSVGNWSSIILVTNSQESETLRLEVESLLGTFKRSKVEVPLVESIDQINEVTMFEIKSSTIKIIVLEFTSGRMVFDFLCQARQFGITTNKGYVFIMRSQAYLNPKSALLPKNCSVKDLQDQFTGSFWIGDVVLGARFLQSINKTRLGYNLTAFKQELFSRQLREATYSGTVACHDAVLQTILTLQTVDIFLTKQNISKSLASQYETYPSLSEEILINITGAIEYTPLANGGRTLKYSTGLEMNSQMQWIFQYDPKDGAIDSIYTVRLANNSDIMVLDDFLLEPSKKAIAWNTQNNEPPHDIERIISKFVRIPTVTYSILFAISIFLILGQLYSLVLTNVLFKYPPIIEAMPRSRGCVLEGLIYMNVAAILCLIDDVSRPDLLCRFRYLVIIAACSRVHGVVAPKVICYVKRLRLNEDISRFTRDEIVQKNERFVIIGSSIFTTVNVVLLLLWFILDPLRSEALRIGNLADLGGGLYVEILYQSCVSDYQPYWIALFSLLHSTLLLVASIFGLVSDSSPGDIAHFGFSDIRQVRFSVWVSFVNFIATIIVVAALHGQTPAQMIVLAIGLLISSLSIDSFLFFPNAGRNSREMFAVIFRRRTYPNENSVPVIALEQVEQSGQEQPTSNN